MVMCRSGARLLPTPVRDLPSSFAAAPTNAAAARTASSSARTWELKLLYDGDCPLCMREVNMLRRRDTAGRIEFVDIASPEYDPVANAGISFELAMERIHAVLPDGTVCESCWQAVDLSRPLLLPLPLLQPLIFQPPMGSPLHTHHQPAHTPCRW